MNRKGITFHFHKNTKISLLQSEYPQE